MSEFIHVQNKTFRVPINRNNLMIRGQISDLDYEKFISLKIIYWNRQLDDPNDYKSIEMTFVSRKGNINHFEGNIITDYPTSYIKYMFVVETKESSLYCDYYGKRSFFEPRYAYEYIYTNTRDVFDTADWLDNAIFYQIFPERFMNGDKSNDPKIVDEWGAVPTRENYMGGDLQGIIDKIDYLSELGINAIYFNPIFSAMSNHKYDTIDYFKIDPHFGTEDDFKALVEKCHQKGIKVILDGVFNHCGTEFPYFVEAMNNKESKYRDWFYIEDMEYENQLKLEFECVGYYRFMPKFNYNSEQVREYIISIGKFWIEKYNIDGWRLDVADEVDYTFWNSFRTEMKKVDKDTVMIAETWSEKQDMLLGDQMDSVMNYLFRDAVLEFIAEDRISAGEFENRLSNIISVYPSNMHNKLYNIIGSHDTERFLTAANGNISKHKLGLLLLMMFNGVPSIYYGDEIPFEGENDPGCRNAMKWNVDDTEVMDYLKKLVEIRKDQTAIRNGRYIANYCDDNSNCHGFIRSYNGEDVYIVINNSSKANSIELPVLNCGVMSELIEGKEEFIAEASVEKKEWFNSDINNYKGVVTLNIEPFSGKILKLK